MHKFRYLEARNLTQAVALLETHGQAGKVVAGSTDFLVRWRLGHWAPEYVVDISRIRSLKTIRRSKTTGLSIGSIVNINALQDHPIIRKRYPALASAAASFAGVQVRNLATIGGNIVNASPAGDTIPALLALDAQCKIVGPKGEVWIPLEDIFLGPGKTILGTSQILAEVHLPPSSEESGSLYIKHSPRSGMDIAAVGVAVAIEMNNQRCSRIRIALGAVAPTPIRAREAEGLLTGAIPDPDRILEAVGLAQLAVDPIDDVRSSADHRREIVGVLTKRAIVGAVLIARSELPFDQQRRLALELSVQ
ncbi:xanthine dehydrogenase family protein subunit M [Dehalococcoidia bacterium]|nr:xanthine dehydrogenase family protein subunit M [Dehalococcoidia bacterium]